MNRVFTVSAPKLEDYCAGKHSLTVLGVFSSGIYLSDDRDGTLLIHDRTYGSVPFGLAGDNISNEAKMLGIVEGDALELDNYRVWLADGSAFAIIEYDAYVPNSPVLPAREAISYLKDNGGAFLMSLKKSALSEFSVRDCALIDRCELDDIFAAAGLGGIQKIEHGLISGNPAELDAGLNGMLGLGRGLTPSFDDFITGMTAALNYFSAEWGIEAAGRQALCALITEKAKKQTNNYSAVYLLSAAEQSRFSVIDDVLAMAGDSQWLSAAERLAAIGGSSGADMMSGLVFAARIADSYILKP